VSDVDWDAGSQERRNSVEMVVVVVVVVVEIVVSVFFFTVLPRPFECLTWFAL
jgi:hypothetical protein